MYNLAYIICNVNLVLLTINLQNVLSYFLNILLTKISAVQNEVALSYHKVRGVYFLAVIVATTITNMQSIQ